MAQRKTSTPAPRAWQRMLSGRRLDLLDPSPFDIEIEDIAQGLARVARWNGQTVGQHAFSVAEHSLIVERLCGQMEPAWPAKWRMAALLHDAPEYVIGDMISPFKSALGFDYQAFEAKLERAVHTRFGLPAHLPKYVKTTIKKADRLCAFFEAVQLAGFSVEEAREFFGKPPLGLRVDIPVRPTEAVQGDYVTRFETLLIAMDEEDRPAGRKAGRS
ncbi:MAG TPA: hydrolase [Oceanicaulis sp.]|nr:HD family hydrolase [Glycocaulis albus]MBV5259414.1 HD family hydrolase [Synechococcus moorigangaii CMS01]HCY54912.1 hydrolase [Oceanicaulis sp.]